MDHRGSRWITVDHSADLDGVEVAEASPIQRLKVGVLQSADSKVWIQRGALEHQAPYGVNQDPVPNGISKS